MQQEILTMSNQQQFLPALTGELISSLGLSDTDLPAIQELADKIQIGYPATIADFGQNASASSVSLADELLTQVRSSDLDNAGDKLNQLLPMGLSPVSWGSAGNFFTHFYPFLLKLCRIRQ